MLVTAVERKYLQRIIFNFHKKNPATQDDRNVDDDDELDNDDDDVVNNLVAVAWSLLCLGKFSTKFARNIFVAFMILAAQNDCKISQKLVLKFAMKHLLVHTIYENIFFSIFCNFKRNQSAVSTRPWDMKKKLVANILY